MKLHGRNISTNSVSFISPICGGGSKTLYIGAETSCLRHRNITFMNVCPERHKTNTSKRYQVRTAIVYHVNTRAMHKVSVQAALRLNNVEQRHQVKRSLKHKAISLRRSIKHANDGIYNPQLSLTFLMCSVGR